MRLLGAEVVAVKSGSRTLKDAINDALRDWVTNVGNTNYIFGTVAGPHPFPAMVRDFQKIIGEEAAPAGARPHRPPARTPSPPASAADPTRWASSTPSSTTRPSRSTASRPPATASTPPATPRPSPRAAPACCTARAAYCCRTRTARPSSRIRSPPASTTRASGRSTPGWPRSAGPRTGPSPTPRRWSAFRLLSRTEGIIPAIESAHALAGTLALGRELGPEATILVNLSGRGDKDMETAGRYFDLLDAGRHSHERHEHGGTPAPSRGREDHRAPPRRGSGALIGYLPVGFPSLGESIDAAVAIVRNGVDILELGLPYSDPVMDGPVIQAATQQRARGRIPGAPRLRGRRRDHRPGRRPGARDDLLEPGACSTASTVSPTTCSPPAAPA